MKKYFLIFLLFFTVNFGFSQRFIGSAILGMNATQVDGDEVYGYNKFGFNVGASVMLALEPKQHWFATVELLFSQKGSFRKSLVDSMVYSNVNNIDYNFDYDSKIKYRLRLNYVEVPIIFHYEDPKTGWAFGAGFAWGRLVNIQEVENGWHLKTNLRSDIYRTSDWSVLGDVKIRLWKGLKLNLRYQYSFVPIRVRTFTNTSNGQTWDRKQYNNVITVRLIYSFNERYRLNYLKNKKGERNGPKWVRDISIPSK